MYLYIICLKSFVVWWSQLIFDIWLSEYTYGLWSHVAYAPANGNCWKVSSYKFCAYVCMHTYRFHVFQDNDHLLLLSNLTWIKKTMCEFKGLTLCMINYSIPCRRRVFIVYHTLWNFACLIEFYESKKVLLLVIIEMGKPQNFSTIDILLNGM